VRFSAPLETGPGFHPAPYTMGTGSFSGVKRPRYGLKHPPPSSAEVKGRVELHLPPLWAFVACCGENSTFFYLLCTFFVYCVLVIRHLDDGYRSGQNI